MTLTLDCNKAFRKVSHITINKIVGWLSAERSCIDGNNSQVRIPYTICLTFTCSKVKTITSVSLATLSRFELNDVSVDI